MEHRKPRSDNDFEVTKMASESVLLDATIRCPEAMLLDRELRARVIGQDEAIGHIVDQYQTHLAGLSEWPRPISSMLLLGPTGCGKTRLVEAVAESLVGTRQALIKVDCGEFQHSHEIAKLIGSPPGYLGHRETHARLSQERLNEFHTESVRVSFVLFDEIEKASDALWNLLLGILDKATLTLGDNRQVDFSRAMVFLTGNLGSSEMQRLLEAPLGFAGKDPTDRTGSGAPSLRMRRKMEKAALESARRKFSPEFLNRLDRVVLCHALDEDAMPVILDLELQEILGRVQRQRGLRLRVSLDAEARAFLSKEGYDERSGARHLKRTLNRSFVHPLSIFLSTGQLQDGDELEISFDGESRGLRFHGRRHAVSSRALRELAASWQPAQSAPPSGRQWRAMATRP